MHNTARQATRTAFLLWVTERLNLRPGESRLVALILLFTIGAFTANVLTYTAAYALFLAKFDAQALPYVYIGESLVSTLLTLLYLRFSRRYALIKMLFGQLIVMTVTMVGYRVGLLRNALQTDLAEQQARLLLWLALLYDPATLQRVRTALALTPGLRRTPTDEQRAYALETLDLLLTKAVSKQLLILLDELPPAQQLKQLAGDAPRTPLPLPRQLTAIITGDER